MKIQITGKRSVISEASKSELRQLEEDLSFRPENYFFAPSYKKGYWDGWIRCFDKLSKSVPRGFTYFIADLYEAEVEDLRDPPILGKTVHVKMDKRDYQQEMIDTMIAKKFGIVHAATNSGKTDMAAAVISRTMVKTIFFVHIKELMEQTAQRLEMRLGLPPGAIGRIGAGKWEERLINVAMIQTYSRNLKNSTGKTLAKSVKMAFFDEGHHLTSNQWTSVAEAFSHCYWAYALTGTVPKDQDSQFHLMSILGSVIAKVSNKFLIEEGFSARPTIYVYRVSILSIDDFALSYKNGIEKNKRRNFVVVDELEKSIIAGESAICVVKHVSHMKTLIKLCKQRNIEGVAGISGSSKNRSSAYAGFSSGSVKALVTTPLFDEGIDLPNIRKYINAAGGLDFKKTLQRIGRGLRKKEGDNQLTVIDFYDNDGGFLLSHSKARIADCKAEGFKVVVIKT